MPDIKDSILECVGNTPLIRIRRMFRKPGVEILAKHEGMISEDEPSFRLALELALKEGLFAGISSGSAMWAAIEQARRLERGNVVLLLPDSGSKYLSTPLFDAKGDPRVWDSPS